MVYEQAKKTLNRPCEKFGVITSSRLSRKLGSRLFQANQSGISGFERAFPK